jgi:hypothetical protein
MHALSPRSSFTPLPKQHPISPVIPRIAGLQRRFALCTGPLSFAAPTTDMAQSTTTGLDAVPSMQRDSAAKSKDTAVSERKEFLRTTRARTAAAAATNRCGQHAAAPAGADADLPPFESLCNDGSAWEWGNLRVKIYRWTILCIKQVYLIFMTLSCPTNHLMVRVCVCDAGSKMPACTCLLLPCLAAKP